MTVKAAPQKKKAPVEVLWERKITAYQEQIAQDEEQLAILNAEKAQINEIAMIGLTVHHKLFGNGKVTEQNGNVITVEFSCGNKRFLVPASFWDGFLEPDDPGVKGQIAQYQKTENQITEIKNRISQVNHTIGILGKK